ncbi:MAG: polyribonucleotide nucleotidyltransferase [Planctomycetes bacterium]|nr:polyribonucleotide nucleotidyltransferase [Planctomycetota bacterium]
MADKVIALEAGWLAKQASGAATMQIADTVVLAAVVGGPPRGLGYEMVPLTVDYRERIAAAGKFPGGFIKREGRPTTKETLTARQVDRPLRPLFPEYMDTDVVVSVTVLSADGENDPDIAAMNAASAALHGSDIPFHGPVGSVRVGLLEDRFVVNPTASELKISSLDLVLSGTRDGVIMVEAGAKEISEERLVKAFEFAGPYIQKMIDLQEELRRAAGKEKKPYDVLPAPAETYGILKENYLDALRAVFLSEGLEARAEAIDSVLEMALETLCPEDELGQLRPGAHQPAEVRAAWDRLVGETVREFALQGRRADGRGLDDIRPIDIRLGFLPRTHGSALFTRGETQALCTTTLGTVDDEQIVDGLSEEYSKRFYLHYNFPSYSVGETKPNRGPGRREIGHGDLAERALDAVIPDHDAFPYTIRVISDILESNGSSSMATVCGGCLSLMDAGVPVKSAVAGIAMGLVREGDRTAVLTDILGSEDAYGDMDFKVAGTADGITSLQMDLKAAGIPLEITRLALEKARQARLHVLGKMNEAIGRPRESISPYAPRLVRIKIDPEKIGLLIGPGGKNIRDIEARSGATVEIEDDGTVTISSRNEATLAVARSMVEAQTEDLKIGQIYPARVVSLKDFGAFCEIANTGRDGLVHVTEITDSYVQNVDDYLAIGMEVEVKLVSTDPSGKNRFSIKQARKEKNLPPLEPLPGRVAAGVPSGGAEERFRASRPPREGGSRPYGDRPPRPHGGRPRGPRRDQGHEER